MKRTIRTLSLLAGVVLLAAGCGVESGTDPVPESPLGLTVAIDLSRPGFDAGEIDDVISKTVDPFGGFPPDSVTVTAGALMVRSIRLVSEPVVSADTIITAADEERDRLDASVAFQGPYVLTVGESNQDLETQGVPIGYYRQVSFVIQEARSTDDLSGHDELVGSSIRLSGRVWRNGVSRAYVYATDYTSEFTLNGNYRVGETGSGSLSLNFAVGQWFHNGSRWLDPENSSDASAIVRNIRRNISGSMSVN
jgi:hypothetical protein